MKVPLQRITSLLQPDRSDLWIVAAYSLAIGLLTLALPVASQSLINTVAFGTVLQPIIVLSLLLFAALMAASALQILRHWLVEVLQRRIFVRVTGDAGDRLIHARSSFFDNVHGPELVNRFLDVAIVQKSVAVLLIDGLTILMQTVAGLLLLAVYHPLLLLFDAVLFAMILFILFGLGRGAIRTSIAESQAKYEVLAWLEELARHPSTFRSSQGMDFGWTRTNARAAYYVEERKSHFRVEMRQIVGSLALQAFALSALLGFGGYLVTVGQLTLGQLVAGELVVGMVVYGFTKLNKSLESFYDLSAAVDELGYLEDLPVERELGSHVLEAKPAASVQLSGVEYCYEAGTNLLRGLNLYVGAGEKVAVQGALGSGKSTLLDLISSLRTPTAGHIEIDGQDYRELRLDSLRTQVVLVRRAEIFAGTLLENLTLGAAVDNRQIRNVLEQVGLQAAVMELPDSTATRLTTGGAPLTRTQALRLVVARALLMKPSVLLVDGIVDGMEGLQANDPLVVTLLAPEAPWTLVLTSDRPEVLQRCGRVYRLSGGSLYEMKPQPGSQENAQ
ncbi:ABC-type bacteriocin/lantibiotic exporter with N-terminal double-glycine peptidase domain [Terriglobus roseus DSM 18391]|uniref:ABC-type bacteriocin/lantibiotic exporter with N-terminal double-glycine peptidase domain n=1 Tax=Terriglobus roseus (strain DSM 18391 / NRRL B-41598 / KBS 63) TaxID=926566 RepID=I3ZE09_TERRK|nr:ATP-binding cassette domain-containing protein [Terriglobus roseus]AFL87477.1 ABC-type bacteriocin/lantibiotic exporter with N-terminal double-glycine peptidase domain [Terriglobus roseus DSM 18391]